MKNIFDVIRSKEQEILKIKKEVEALRLVVRLLADDSVSLNDGRAQSRVLEMPDSDELLDLRLPEQPTA